MTSTKGIRQIGIDEAREWTGGHALALYDDLVVIDDFSKIDMTDTAWQLRFLAYCFCTHGHSVFRLNGKGVEMAAGDLFLGVGEHVFHMMSTSDDFQARVILIARKCVQDSIVGLHQLWPYLLYVYDQPVIHLNKAECEVLNSSYDYAVKRLSMKDHHYLRETITALIRLFYFDVCDLLSRHCDTSLVTARIAGYGIFDKFIRLVDANFKRERNVAWYSDRLCLTPKYLSEVVKSISGKTAGQWITNLVVIEIKQLLGNTSLSIKEIAREVNFSNQSFLGKYFKNATGYSPLEYRKKMGSA